MAGSSIDLMSLFQAASSVLSQNKTELNQADPYNHDHGNNISQVFNLITQAVGQKQSASPSTQLNYASQVLQQQATSGSSQLYAQALKTAASQLQGQSNISANNIMPLLQSLLGGGQQPNPNAMTGGGSGDLLGGLLSAFTGGSAQPSGVGTQQGGGGIQMDDILRGGMAFLQAQQSGGGGVQGVVDALIAGSPLGESPARAQSAQLIAHSILAKAAPLLNQMTNKKPAQKTGQKAAQLGAKKAGATGSRAGGAGKREPSRGKSRSR
jgi:hypothetical protein